jgi:hypothetical protein
MKDKLTLGLPNSCAIHSAALSWIALARTGCPARVILAFYPDGNSHTFTFFEFPNGRAVAYDQHGTRFLKGISSRSPVLAIARKACGSHVRSASWIMGGPPKQPTGTRQLSPREVRSFRPALDRLLEQQDAPRLARRMSPRERRIPMPFDLLMRAYEG